MYDWPFWKFVHRVVRPGDAVADVGSNVGLFSVAMAAIVGASGHVSAVEPDPVLAELVRDNLTSNWMAPWTTVHEVAAGAATGDVTFSRHARYWGSSSAGASSLGGHAISDGYEQIRVKVERLDDILPDLHYRLIKIDVEGGEAQALHGLSNLLKRNRIEFIDLEVLRGTAHDWDAMASALTSIARDFGGRPHVVDPRGRLRAISLHDVVTVADFGHVVFDLRRTADAG